jgi:Ca2+-binding EF-hand superfamily protein
VPEEAHRLRHAPRPKDGEAECTEKDQEHPPKAPPTALTAVAPSVFFLCGVFVGGQEGKRVLQPKTRTHTMAMPLSHKPFLQEVRQCQDLFEPSHPRITGAEVKIVLRSLGWDITTENVQKCITKVDCDGSGCITLPEFVTLIMQLKDPTSGWHDDELRESFRALRGGETGLIRSSDLVTFLSSTQYVEGASYVPIKEGDIQELMTQSNVDPEGEMHFEQFVRLVLPPPPAAQTT